MVFPSTGFGRAFVGFYERKLQSSMAASCQRWHSWCSRALATFSISRSPTPFSNASWARISSSPAAKIFIDRVAIQYPRRKYEDSISSVLLQDIFPLMVFLVHGTMESEAKFDLAAAEIPRVTVWSFKVKTLPRYEPKKHKRVISFATGIVSLLLLFPSGFT